MSETYESILNKMNEKFEEFSGYSPDDASDIGIRFKVLAGEVYSMLNNIEWVKRQMFPQTASGDELSLHAVERGLSRKAGSKSNGSLTFSRTRALSYDVVIPAGTICSTPGVNGVRVATKSQATLLANTTSITVLAESLEGSSKSNLDVNSVTVLVNPPAGINSVTNSVAFTGGTDSETDESLRERILDSYLNIPNGTNAAFYYNCVMKYDDIYSANVIAKARGEGTVDVYVGAKGGAPSATLISQIQSEIDNLREINVDVDVKAPTLESTTVSATIDIKSGYNSTTVINACKAAIKSYFDSLSIGEDVLLAGISDAIYHTDGVTNYEISNPLADVSIDSGELAVYGTVTVSERA